MRSPALVALYEEARRVAPVKVPVLITGERGTGKTTLASALRAMSPFRQQRKDSSWPALACGQFRSEAMQAELLGYEKGAFTGASERRVGLLEEADGDTLFLDEIADLSPDVQRLLIRALEERRFTPIKAKKPVKSDFRLISATNRTEEELAARLDADFFDRVSYLRLHIPPLREAREDLDWMWDDVLRRARSRAAATGPAGPDDVANRMIVARLREHSLPGNYRDLFRVAYRLLAALADQHRPLQGREAAAYALEALGPAANVSTRTPEQRLAEAFANARPLDGVLGPRGTVRTRPFLTGLERWLAVEIRRVAKERGVPAEELADVTDRTLRNWLEKKPSS